MNKINDIIDYTKYSYDDILDVYSRTKDKRFISYCHIKENNYDFDTLLKMFDTTYDKLFVYLFNTQRMIDGLPVAENYEKVSELLNCNYIDEEDDEFFDF